MNTEELKKITPGEEKAYQFESPALLHSFTSVISYVNRLYMKPTGKILRYSRDYNAYTCNVRCEAYKIPNADRYAHPQKTTT